MKQYAINVWEIEHEFIEPTVHFQIVPMQSFRRDRITQAIVRRGNRTVYAYCDCFHLNSPLPKQILEEAANAFHDGDYVTHHVDLSD